MMRVLVLFGGRSGEHEVSVVSARSVATALDELGHDVLAVGVSRAGHWVRCDPREVDVVPETGEPYGLTPGPHPPADVDVAFPVLHGPFGEDGSIQGLLELSGLAYVGSGVEGSALGVNKVLQKRLFAESGFPIVAYEPFDRAAWAADAPAIRERVAALGFPSFAKPARLGSSVGISKIHDRSEIDEAVERALHHDDLALVEASGGSREVEVAALEGPGGVELSVPGEIVPDGDFYDYEAKYRSADTELRVPAPLAEGTVSRLHDIARRAFVAGSCEGLARIDFFLAAGDEIVLNEINTLPGLTPSSMYPRLWEASGRPFPEVVDVLLAQAVRRRDRRRELEQRRMAHHAEEVGGRA